MKKSNNIYFNGMKKIKKQSKNKPQPVKNICAVGVPENNPPKVN